MKRTLNQKGLYLFFPVDAENIEASVNEVHELLSEQIKNNPTSGLWGDIYQGYIDLQKRRNLILQSTAQINSESGTMPPEEEKTHG
jgi:hypothetical protein